MVLYTFILILAISLSYVENAPSTLKKHEDELTLRLVFVNNIKERINSNSRSGASRLSTASPLQEKSSFSNTDLLTGPVFGANSPVRPKKVEDLTRMDDERQNWGLIIEDKEIPEDESYYSRPLTIPKTINTKVLSRKQTKVASKTSVTPSNIAKPSSCDAAVVTCCVQTTKVKECFDFVGCPNVTEDIINSNLCHPKHVQKKMEDIAKFYFKESETTVKVH